MTRSAISGRNGRTRAAAQAWQELTGAVGSGGDAVRTLTRRSGNLVGGAGDRVGSAVGESRRRAGAALDALAGRRIRRPWEWIFAATAGGAVLGWVAAILSRRAVEQAAIAAELDEASEVPPEAVARPFA